MKRRRRFSSLAMALSILYNYDFNLSSLLSVFCMGKSLPSSASKLQQVAKTVASSSHKPSQHKKTAPASVSFRQIESERGKVKKMDETTSLSLEGQNRVPLALVVSDCVHRWFHDTLKDARAGDVAMQVLVGQMYCRGYGVPKDALKGRAWIDRASKGRASVWKVGDKHPGYNASDSDTEEVTVDKS